MLRQKIECEVLDDGPEIFSSFSFIGWTLFIFLLLPILNIGFFFSRLHLKTNTQKRRQVPRQKKIQSGFLALLRHLSQVFKCTERGRKDPHLYHWQTHDEKCRFFRRALYVRTIHCIYSYIREKKGKKGLSVLLIKCSTFFIMEIALGKERKKGQGRSRMKPLGEIQFFPFYFSPFCVYIPVYSIPEIQTAKCQLQNCSRWK